MPTVILMTRSIPGLLIGPDKPNKEGAMFVSIFINANKVEQNVSFCCQNCGT